MIEFRQKKYLIQDLMPEAIDRLRHEGIPFNTITPERSDEVSRVNSRAMVLVSFIRNERGYPQIQIKDKELGRYTKKLVEDIFRMRILDLDKRTRTLTAECDHKGIALDFIEILGYKYNLSIVQ